MKLLLSLALTLVAAEKANAQCAFTFCGGLANIPDQTLDIDPFGDPSTESVTCADVFAAAETPGSYTATQCEQSVKGFENICCPAQATRQCFLCGDSQVAFNSDNALLAASCAVIDQGLSILPSGDTCNQAKSTGPYNLASYCGCPGATAPNTCKLCPEGQVVNAAASAPALEGVTCGDGAAIASHVTDDTACAELNNNSTITAACCVSSGINLSISSVAATLIVGLAVAII